MGVRVRAHAYTYMPGRALQIITTEPLSKTVDYYKYAASVTTTLGFFLIAGYIPCTAQ